MKIFECPLCAKSGHRGASLFSLPITEDAFCIYPIMCAFLQKILLRVVILSICLVHDGGNNERKRGMQHFNFSCAFLFALWNSLG